MLFSRDPLKFKGHIQTESEMMEENIQGKWESKESWGSNIHIRQKKNFKIKNILRKINYKSTDCT